MTIRYLNTNPNIYQDLDLDKFSHPNKTLRQHIEEIKILGRELREIYNFDWDLFEFLSEFHDFGKLEPDWSINKKRNISHSAYSLYRVYLYYKEYLENKIRHFDILLYLVYRHHSLLTKNSCHISHFEDVIRLSNLRNKIPGDFFENIRKKIENLDFEEKIKIIDTFGIFKLCDIFSAKNKKLDISTFKINKDPLDFIKPYIKNNEDNKKFEIQKEISNHEEAILIAPTGWGKTTMSPLFLKDRLFVTLPTITAIKKFYNNLIKFFGEERVGQYFYVYDPFLFDGDDDNNILEEERFLSYELSKLFLRPVMITTIDQILFTFLQAGKYYIRRFNFQKASFVIDEVHLLTPQMLYLFLYFYKNYKKLYNLRLLLMSATFPKAYQKFIEEFIPNINKYSLIDEYKQKRRVLFKYFEEDIVNWIKQNIEFFNHGDNQNKKFLIIVNTTKKAQEIYEILRDYNPLLLHAKFMTKDRFEKEENIDKYRIIITTQVAEVSLNISKDFLLTELASLPALIQRFGRVNRFSDKTDTVNAYIFKPKEAEKSYKNYPYSFEELEATEKVIKDLENKLKSEYQLIEEYDKFYRYEDIKNELENTIIYGKDIKDLLKFWENEYQFFYTAISRGDPNQEIVDELFKLRNNTSSFVLLDPKIIDDNETADELKEILKEWDKTKSFDERKKLFLRLKDFIIPMPFWILKQKTNVKWNVFPIVYSSKVRYSKDLGLYVKEEINKDYIYY